MLELYRSIMLQQRCLNRKKTLTLALLALLEYLLIRTVASIVLKHLRVFWKYCHTHGQLVAELN